MNPRGDTLVVMTKRSLLGVSWELHLALFLSEKGSDAITCLLLVNLVHFPRNAFRVLRGESLRGAEAEQRNE